jgi:excisionase family DNA binding protein
MSRSTTLLRKEQKMMTTDNTFTDYPDIISVKQLQEMLHIGKNRALELLRNNEIPYIKIGYTFKIPKVHVIEFLNRNSIGS